MQHITCVLVIIATGISISSSNPGLPVLLIPGNGGNQLEARLDDNWGNKKGCPNPGTWFRLWLDVWQVLSKDKLKCFSDIMELEFDPFRGQSVNKAGVEVRVPGFADTSSVELLDPSWSAYILGNAGSYYQPLVKELISWGYSRGVDIRAAPYDFRFAPGSLPEYHTKLKALVEQMYRENSYKKVVLVSHSAGGLFAHYFLTHQPQDWKTTHIETLISVATPWKGAPLLLRAIVSGFNFDIPLLDSLTVRAEQRSSQVNMLLLPQPPIWQKRFVFITSPSKNYSLENIAELFDDLSFPAGHPLLQLTTGADYTFEHPGVEVHCWFGKGVDTPDAFVYGDGFPDSPPSTVHYTDGDGTVPSKSAQACEMWNNNLNNHYPIHTKEFRSFNHLEIIKNKAFLEAIRNIVY